MALCGTILQKNVPGFRLRPECCHRDQLPRLSRQGSVPVTCDNCGLIFSPSNRGLSLSFLATPVIVPPVPVDLLCKWLLKASFSKDLKSRSHHCSSKMHDHVVQLASDHAPNQQTPTGRSGLSQDREPHIKCPSWCSALPHSQISK